ncbi:hypothetical protein RJ641_031875 [Dillenia turbinata]|uniref:NAD(+) kinase n=1 Tax=Dillenia turbinata TaxID=194707 RepID=A0AAN8W3F9_9MAGN
MNHSVATATATPICSLGSRHFTGVNSDSNKLFRLRLVLQRKDRWKRRLRFVVSAELSRPFSLDLVLDSQTFQDHDPQQLPWVGPVPGDIAEVEAYCRIFRAAERLHLALMDTLCNPLTGECSVSYEFTMEEKPLLEDKIVSVLGCILSLLNKGREDVLSGRSSMNTFRMTTVNVIEDKLPPLAAFRSEMKRCCESLHIALENFLTPDDERSLDVWRKLQRLKNVCYDSGFPRPDGYPCHSLLANWKPVYMSTSREELADKDSDVAFWKGGQVTEEGLKWLLQKGFRTIIDLRSESVKDNLYQAALDDAILSGKVELLQLPVEVGTAPTMEQVEKFAGMVSDISKKPIYLHSKEGVWRTSAMVSRWRQYMSRCALQVMPNNVIGPAKYLTQDSKGASMLDSFSEKKNDSSLETGCDSLTEKFNTVHSANGSPLNPESVASEISNKKMNGVSNGIVSSKDATSFGTAGVAENVLWNFNVAVNPLKAQLPPCDVFSKKEMSQFMKSKSISPSSYINHQWKNSKVLPVSREKYIKTGPQGRNYGNGLASWPVEDEISRGKLNQCNLSPDPQKLANTNGKPASGGSPASSGRVINGKKQTLLKNNKSSGVGYIFDKSFGVDHESSVQTHVAPVDDGLALIEGNMCASTTGVVRVQSRKKAEMYLVRTDGFSCTREKVTEASLAFTHPSTQQQMLMWKSTPKTVLLLKKLGPDLMEETKEVASYLYYEEKMNVLVEPNVHDIFASIPGFGFVQTFYGQDTSDLHERVDFVACLGGDGVILHASNLFRGPVPPVVSFKLGSLGFLTSHTFNDYKQDLRQVIHGNNTLDGVYITLRLRLRCEIFRNGKAMPGKVFDVLNEVVVDRGSNPYLSKIECYEHDRLITKVQGDGIIVATPTGSTGYSTSAGGSMVHPNVPCMLFTPICPHSLSFRPVILPDSARLELKIPENARSNAWVSFDGKRRQQLSIGDSVRISMSQHPLPTVNKSDQTGDWFHSLIRCLNWNERLDQKAFCV